MTTFYVGYRPVLRGRDADNSVHYWKNEAGTYSNWELQNTEHVLAGAPDNPLAEGEEYLYRKIGLLEYIRSGGHHIAPMKAPGLGDRQDTFFFRQDPNEYKGLDATKALGSPGHAPRTLYYSHWNNFSFEGVPSGDATLDGGHAHRTTAAWGGAHEPYIYQGVSALPLDGGQAAADMLYGGEKVNEWQGVASAQALR